MKKLSTQVIITSAIAAGALMASATPALAGNKKSEKCYGIVKAQKNDCGIKSQGTSCAGAAKKDGIHDAWIYLPKGTCEKIVGAHLTPKTKS